MAQLKQVCTVTNGSQTVTVIGVNVAYRILANSIFMTSPDFVPYTVAKDAVFDGTNTVITLAAMYQGASVPMAQGVFATDFTYPDHIPLLSQGDVGTAAIWTKAMYQLQSMIGSVTPAGLNAFIAQINQTQANADADAAAALASQNAAKTSETNSKTSETNAAASKSAAATSATNAKTSETNSKTSETNAAASATASASSATAAAGSKTAAATSETNASNSAAAANTSKTNAATSETNAANSAAAALASQNAAKTSETNSKTSETNSKTSETNAASSKTAAAGSATAAAGSATAAAGSATAAAGSASSAAADRATVQGILTTMNALYLGNKASPPTLDNSGNALQLGAEYFDTTKQLLRVYTSTGWQDYDKDAQTQATNATASAATAAGSAAGAATSATNAHTSELNAAASAAAALVSQNAAKTSETNSKTSETNAKTSETNSKTSETNSKTSENNAAASAAHADQVAQTIGNPVSKNGDTMAGNLWVGDPAPAADTGQFTLGSNYRVGIVRNSPSGLTPYMVIANSQLQVATPPASQSEIGSIGFRWGSTTADPLAGQTAADIHAYANTDGSASLGLFSRNSAGSVIGRVYLTGAGRLLVGTATDDGSNMLQVAGSVAISGNQTLTNTASSTVGSISSSAYTGGLSIEAFNVGNTAKKNLALSPWGGRVLIGTTTDDGSNLLQVAGTVKSSGSITTSGAFNVDGAAGAGRSVYFKTTGSNRWEWKASADAESGSNAGSNLQAARYTDAGAFIDVPFSLSRATGVLALTQRPTFAGFTPWDSGNVTPFDKALGGTISAATFIDMTPTATNAHLSLRGSAGALSTESKLRFHGTFGSGSDLGQRLVASIRAGFNAGTWGKEYLDFYLNSASNDAASDANQIRMLRLAYGGRMIVGNNAADDGVTTLQVGGSVKATGAAFSSAVINSMATSSSIAGAFRTTGELGGAWVDWNSATPRTYALQIDAPTFTGAYGGMRWTRQGGRHLAAIDAYEGGTATSAPSIVMHVDGQNNAWTFGRTDITRGAGGYVWHTGNLTPSNYVAKAGDTMTNELGVQTNGDQGYYTRLGPGYMKLARYDYGSYIDFTRVMSEDYKWRIHYNFSSNQLEFLSNGGQSVSFLTDGNIFCSGRGYVWDSINAKLPSAGGTLGYVYMNGAAYAGYQNFGYLNTGGASTYGTPQNNGNFAAIAQNMIAAAQFWSVSDQRLKTDIEDLNEGEAVAFVQEVTPKRYLKEGVREWGFIAQDVGKSLGGKGSELLTCTPREGLEEETDEDGFVSPEGHALNVSHNQIIPIHAAVLRNLLRRMAMLEEALAKVA